MPGRLFTPFIRTVSYGGLLAMIEILFTVGVIAALANMAISVPFVQALRREAPEVLASFALSMGRRYTWGARIRYSKLILLREYRSRLSSCPQSRAWASWLFLVHWVQLLTVLVFLLVLLMR
jgi:hypothetical protein